MNRVVGWLALVFLAVGTAGCTYDGPDDSVPTPYAELTVEPSVPPSTRAPEVLATETSNYAILKDLLGSARGAVILEDSGAMDGPARGFGRSGLVEKAGAYTVTTACVGASDARLFLIQDNPRNGFSTLEFPVDCSRISSRAVELQQGYISAHLLLSSPGDTPWTGAVAGVRVTAGVRPS